MINLPKPYRVSLISHISPYIGKSVGAQSVSHLEVRRGSSCSPWVSWSPADGRTLHLETTRYMYNACMYLSIYL